MPITELPQYRCHKVVRAAKIKSIYALSGTDGFCAVAFVDDAGCLPRREASEWRDKHKPEVGGYYVVYADGYTSYSPAQAFEEGYTRIEEVPHHGV